MSENDRSTIPGPHFVISTEDGAIHGKDTPENRDLVRRIHACVKACDGIPTEELEGGIIQEMQSLLAQVVPVLQERVPTRKQGQIGRPLVVENRATKTETIIEH